MVWYQFLPGLADLVSAGISSFGVLASLGPACGSRRSTSSIGIFVTSSRSSCSSGCTFRRLASAPSVVPEQWRLLYSLNPMVGVIDGFRWCILGGQSQLYLPGLAFSIVVTAFFLWFGIDRFPQNGEEALRI